MNLNRDQILATYRRRKILLVKAFSDNPTQLVIEIETACLLRDLALQKIRALTLRDLNYVDCEEQDFLWKQKGVGFIVKKSTNFPDM